MKKNSVGIKLNGLNNVVARCIESKSKTIAQNKDKLSVINGRILGYIYENRKREVFAKDIETEFMVTRSTVSKVIDTMESKGLIKRVAIERDARLKKLVLTESAEEMVRKIQKELKDFELKMLEGFSEDEKEQLISYLDRMTTNILGIM